MSEHGPLEAAHATLAQIGGVNGNGVADLAPLATALALVAIAEEVRALRLALAPTTPKERAS